MGGVSSQHRSGQHVPDILDCLAQLSNDEVPTPPKVVKGMLDTLPEHVWSAADYRWLDPFSKSGVFLREVAARLLEGLSEQYPNFQARREHIFHDMLYGTSTSTMAGMISRRTLYYSHNASGPASVVHFDDPDGNLPFVPTQHTRVQKKNGTLGNCTVCGAKPDLDRGEGRENYAYSFIHGTYPTKELAHMNFDVIIGNPPYQLGDGGGGGKASATPIYNRFVERALDLNPRHVVMITPSRWFSGGKQLDKFRDRMLQEGRFVTLVDHPQLYDCFPGVKIRGGVSYWHWDREHHGPCRVVTKVGDQVLGEPAVRDLGAYDVLVRRNEAVDILDQVTAHRVEGKPEPRLSDQVSPRKPFGLTNQKGAASPAKLDDPVLLYGNQMQSYIERSKVTHHQEWVDDWKVLLVKAHGTSGKEDTTILGEPVVAAPGSACTETYLVIGRADTEKEAQRLAAYMRTRFVRFLVSLRKITQNITRASYQFVPALPMDRTWTDEMLYQRYGLSAEQIAFVESHIQERPGENTFDEADDDDD